MGAHPPTDGTFTFIGTATVLLRYRGFTILTDPNFLHAGEHAYVGMGLRTRRLTEPAMSIEELPRLDLCVLSHHHGDHFDRRAAAGLEKDLPIVTEPHSARKLRSQGFEQVHELRTWERQAFVKNGERLVATSMPGKHAPLPLGLVLPSVMGTMLEFEDLRVYITGDTLFHDDLAEIPERYPNIDLCLIHLGGTRVAGVLLTMDAEQGMRTLQLVRPRAAVPIHYDDYTLFKDPLANFQQRVTAAGDALSTSVHYVNRGDVFDFTSLRRPA